MIEMSPAYSERCRTYIVAGKKREKDYKNRQKTTKVRLSGDVRQLPDIYGKYDGNSVSRQYVPCDNVKQICFDMLLYFV
jgi:hypothetical protein